MSNVNDQSKTHPAGRGGANAIDPQRMPHPLALLQECDGGADLLVGLTEPKSVDASGLTGAGKVLLLAKGNLLTPEWSLRELVELLKQLSVLLLFDDGADHVVTLREFDGIALSYETAAQVTSKAQAYGTLCSYLRAMGVEDEEDLGLTQAELDEFESLQDDGAAAKSVVASRLKYMAMHFTLLKLVAVDPKRSLTPGPASVS